MNLVVHHNGGAVWNGRPLMCVIGYGGVSDHKQEGDGTTPVGAWPAREVFFRGDRITQPITKLPCQSLSPRDGWCDDPLDSQYNRRVELPYPASHEVMMREDGLYDLIVVLGYNDEPVVAGRGSAIFLHVAAPDLKPTQGCIALRPRDLLRVVSAFVPGDIVEVVGPTAI